MSQKKTKNQTKSQKPIRTDVWDLSATESQKHQMALTVAEYRRFLRPLVLVVNARWISLGNLTTKERVNAVEKIIHQTAKNPVTKQQYFQKVVSKYPSFRKFPSYLRRAAIADAIGIVSSFHSRYRQWQSGIRKSREARPPKLTVMCNSYPALYKGQQIIYNSNYSRVALKVWNGTDWIWLLGIKVKKHGLNRHLITGNKIQSPALVVNKKTCQLSMPVQVEKVKMASADCVCSVDLGINNAATASIVAKNGTVKARKFINPARDIDRRNQRRMMISKKSKQTKNLIESALPKGFCQGLYRKSANINLEISRVVMRNIIKFAKTYNVKVIVFENLAGWKAKAGKKGSLQKQKFHLWCHRKIVSSTQERWSELGGEIVFINPKYTSAYAFDGSGKVRRDKDNYSLCRFNTGKRYNADLSASYNIGARYWYGLLLGDKYFSRVYEGKSSHGTSRTPITLDTLRNLSVS
ncbi:MAG: IS200/IS605 family accessory protein TnpB-related protein [Prochloraceae cyanobacterium]|nr:IS200/IS605 family accessory protein TnpB-related protein [Prochloraceae cyanobacterium]